MQIYSITHYPCRCGCTIDVLYKYENSIARGHCLFCKKYSYIGIQDVNLQKQKVRKKTIDFVRKIWSNK